MIVVKVRGCEVVGRPRLEVCLFATELMSWLVGHLIHAKLAWLVG